jgi:UDP-N-acetylmuramate--alanine ligase
LEAFDDADVLLLTDVYAAGEPRLDTVSGEALFHALRRRGHLDVRYVATRARVAEALRAVAMAGDLVLTLGAGDIHRSADELLELLRAGVSVPIH